MKRTITSILLSACLAATALPASSQKAENLVIITLDGFRWQELFYGADSSLLSSTYYTPDTATMQLLYGDASNSERRKQLLPFFWNVIAKRGQLYGNRSLGNKINVSNIYAISYPGYNEIFTGHADITVTNNKRKNNRNINVLEYLESKPEFEGRVAAFTSWDVFPYIFNCERNGLPVNSGYAVSKSEEMDFGEALLQKVQQEGINNTATGRYDLLTFLTAKEHLAKHKPRVLYLGLGETDDAAHAKRYDLYLQKAAQADKMIADLWHWLQTTPGYQNNTVMLITTDHGRGSKPSNWDSHGFFIKGSAQTWLAVMGPGIAPIGEVKEPQQWHQKQLAQTMAVLIGEKFIPEDQPVAGAISLK
ncbi:MAG TPA: alkaline phosphatase family protein [Chitinophagaceae bacterium]|nr:alkaline phosphatase family protein [Chitinophagaceae bacterium]